jgi:DNA-binding CsgD family transcriptional regulator
MPGERKMTDNTISFLVSKGLTIGEARVAGRVLDGKSNAEIAKDLFISVKTVKFHLTKSYIKANVKTRSQFIIKFLVESLISENVEVVHAPKYVDGRRQDLI